MPRPTPGIADARGLPGLAWLAMCILLCGCAQEQTGDSYDLTQCPEVIELTANAVNFHPVFGFRRLFPVFVCDPPAFRYQFCVYVELAPTGDICLRAYTYLKKLKI